MTTPAEGPATVAEHASPDYKHGYGDALRDVAARVDALTADRERVIANVRALADQWNGTPDYTPTDYDRGRVEQRHDMTGQLLELLPAAPTGDQS